MVTAQSLEMVVKDGKITESKYDNVNENGESKQKMQNTTKHGS